MNQDNCPLCQRSFGCHEDWCPSRDGVLTTHETPATPSDQVNSQTQNTLLPCPFCEAWSTPANWNKRAVPSVAGNAAGALAEEGEHYEQAASFIDKRADQAGLDGYVELAVNFRSVARLLRKALGKPDASSDHVEAVLQNTRCPYRYCGSEQIRLLYHCTSCDKFWPVPGGELNRKALLSSTGVSEHAAGVEPENPVHRPPFTKESCPLCCAETPATEQKSPREGQLSLPEILDLIEARAKRYVNFGEARITDSRCVSADTFVDDARSDVPALVKALRWAITCYHRDEPLLIESRDYHLAQLLREQTRKEETKPQ